MIINPADFPRLVREYIDGSSCPQERIARKRQLYEVLHSGKPQPELLLGVHDVVTSPAHCCGRIVDAHATPCKECPDEVKREWCRLR